MITIYHNAMCSKSRCAINYLNEQNIHFDIINYLDTPPTEKEIKDILEKLNMSAKDIIRTGEEIWKEKFKGKDFSESELITILSENPILIQRPITVKNSKAIIARSLENLRALVSVNENH